MHSIKESAMNMTSLQDRILRLENQNRRAKHMLIGV
ncbi:MAG: hypothetical protein ACI8TQ_002798, partial [Planctomycetota bacterium]